MEKARTKIAFLFAAAFLTLSMAFVRPVKVYAANTTSKITYYRNWSKSDSTKRTQTVKASDSKRKFYTKSAVSSWKKSGKYLAGWATKRNGSVKYKPGKGITKKWISKNKTKSLYAVWKKKKTKNQKKTTKYSVWDDSSNLVDDAGAPELPYNYSDGKDLLEDTGEQTSKSEGIDFGTGKYSGYVRYTWTTGGSDSQALIKQGYLVSWGYSYYWAGEITCTIGKQISSLNKGDVVRVDGNYVKIDGSFYGNYNTDSVEGFFKVYGRRPMFQTCAYPYGGRIVVKYGHFL